MRDPNEEHGVFSSIACGVLHRPAWMLLEQIIDVLNASNLALADTIDAFVKPPDGRPERNPIVAHFAALLQLLQRFPKRIIVDLLHPDVMKLKQVDAVR